jgi:hypothetical protein
MSAPALIPQGARDTPMLDTAGRLAAHPSTPDRTAHAEDESVGK